MYALTHIMNGNRKQVLIQLCVIFILNILSLVIQLHHIVS